MGIEVVIDQRVRVMAGKTESVSIRVPYKNLKDEAEVEMVGMDESFHSENHRIDLNSSSSSPSSPSPLPSSSSSSLPSFPPREKHISLVTLVLSCTVAAGVQFGWALQLSLLTPYIQVPYSLSLSLLSFEFWFYYVI